MASYSQNDLLLAILCELRILNQLMAEVNGRKEDIQLMRTDLANTFPLLNSLLIPTGG